MEYQEPVAPTELVAKAPHRGARESLKDKSQKTYGPDNTSRRSNGAFACHALDDSTFRGLQNSGVVFGVESGVETLKKIR